MTAQPVHIPDHTIPTQAFRQALLEWYKVSARQLPWRETTDPYAIWLAETMLQQTTVATVIPYWLRFLSVFPTVDHLAAAPLEQVLGLWQGLGYYRRAHLLHKCAQAVVNDHAGVFPNTLEGLLALPGIGPYSAAAIAATAFNIPASVLDGNVERVVGRLYRIAEPLPRGKPRYRSLAAALASPEHPRLYANAIMELGATVCTPKNPACTTCPVQTLCAAKAHGDQTLYPVKTAAKKLPVHTATAYVITDPNGGIYLTKRGTTGMLAGLYELPSVSPAPLPLGWPQQLNIALPAGTPSGTISHTFSHFKLNLSVVRLNATLPDGTAYPAERPPPLSTLMKKALATKA